MQPQVLADGRRPACQSALAGLIRAVDPAALQAMLATVADDHAFSPDAYAMLSRVCHKILED